MLVWLASLVQMESSLSGCLRRRRMFITEEAWSRARQHQANSTDDTTSELSEEDWEPALGSTIDKRHVWLRISEKGDALAELFVCLFVCFWSSRCPSSPSFVGFVWWLKGVMVGRNYSNVAIIWYFSTKGLFQGREFNQEAAAIIQRKLVTSKTLNVPSFNKRCSNTDGLQKQNDLQNLIFHFLRWPCENCKIDTFKDFPSKPSVSLCNVNINKSSKQRYGFFTVINVSPSPLKAWKFLPAQHLYLLANYIFSYPKSQI